MPNQLLNNVSRLPDHQDAPKNGINDLRDVLFDTMRGLLDKDAPLDIDRAKAVSEVAQTIINSAKVEVQYLGEVGGQASPFLSQSKNVLTYKAK